MIDPTGRVVRALTPRPPLPNMGEGVARSAGGEGSGGPAATSDEARLRKTAQQLEGVFVEQLFKAMRETVPEGGLLDGGAGEEIFTGLLDQQMAAEVPADWESGLGAALYRQLRGVLNAAPAADPSSGGGEG